MDKKAEYQVLARKWRPQQFADVVGQEHVARTLQNAIATGRVAHAYLLVGPRGVGKTSSARILAKALNCRQGPTATPCDQCDSCREIMAGNNLDVLEIDAASNTGVDNVRELRDNVRFAPSRGPYKVYIIDEVHMLSNAAFNALLKTLEEPPRHVKFIFATTEPQKVPATILSRCQRFDLRPIATRDIIAHLGKIAAAEGVTIDENALLAIARGADGGMRDAESTMDQLIAFKGKTIQEADVTDAFGLAARAMIEGLVDAMVAGDTPAALQLVAQLDESGKDLPRVVVDVLKHLRNLLVVLYTGGSGAGLDLSAGQIETLKQQATRAVPANLLRMADIFNETDQRLRYALSKRTLLEMAVIRAAHIASMTPLDDVLRAVVELRNSLGAADPAAMTPAPAPRTMPPPPAPTAPLPAAVDKKKAAPAEPPPAPAHAVTGAAPADDVARLAQAWHAILDRVHLTAPLLRTCLLDAKPLRVDGARVEVGLDPRFAEKTDTINHDRNRRALRQEFSATLGRDITAVEFRVLDAPAVVPADKPQAHHPPRPAPEPPAAKPAKPGGKQRLVRDPLVRKAIELFNGDIEDIRE